MKPHIWKSPAKTFIFVLIYVFIIQLSFPALFSTDVFYHNRMDYARAKDNPHDFQITLEAVKRDIDSKHLQQYLIILGDSVMYGSPGNSNQNVNAYMKDSSKLPIYNLSFPGSQIGDLYAMLLKMDALGISSDHLMFNIRYSSFVKRNYWQPVLAWFQNDLRTLEPDTYQHMLSLPDVEDNDTPANFYSKSQKSLNNYVLPHFVPYLYKDYWDKWVQQLVLKLANRPPPDDTLEGGDPRPWTEKEDVSERVKDPNVIAAFDPKPFNMTDTNPDIYFLKKIIEHQKGKQTLAVLTGTNHTLAQTFVEDPKYVANMQALDQFMQNIQNGSFKYVNMEKQIPDALFTDHLHLTPDGYRQLADKLLKAYDF
ncbi:SGNH/GDSL hydrolase family protein [Paenibacillus sedimenti]|uniref:SGNH/GDSL hydrolase family protein n=1 Tax=Paenibacillus sedimenti TaxID=2770274 RepID=A0A926KP90_9BACL|nr:SGNH/GDSL hydrolase family protein [Paenibacillus sedimenti]MBD0380778.1 SGNH/GDSL hydrolase family protein [Paenibacillus sedimenti]